MRSILILLFAPIILLGSLAFGQLQNWEYNPNAILALALARAGDLIAPADMYEVTQSMHDTGKVPMRYQKTFERMSRLAQILIEMKGTQFYFPVGYEFETAHGYKESWDNFYKGAEKLAKSVNKSFGVTGKTERQEIIKEGSKKQILSFIDNAMQAWSVVPEFVREEYSTAETGWELVSPPMFNIDYLREMSGLILQLGKNKYGQSAELTGGHQTFQAYPLGLAYNANTHGLIIANYLLLKEQFVTAIFALNEVQRYGGVKNFFIRPIVLDHGNMLQELADTDPQLITPQYMNDLMNKKYGVQEFDAHVTYSENYDQREKAQMLAWSESKKLAYPKLWKYRNTRVKYYKDNLILLEDRMGEYRAGEPDYSMRVTFFNQLLLNAATRLAQQGKLYKFKLTPREANESDDAYWARLAANTSLNPDKLLQTIGASKNIKNILMGKAFETRGPRFKVADKPSWGFEMEFVGHQFVDIVVPKGAKARAEWREMSRKQKIKYVASLIADEDVQKTWFEAGYLTYSPDTRRIVTIEFQADTLMYPYLDPDLFLEDSGNFEIKTNGRFVFEFADLQNKIKSVSKILSDYAMHVHLFIPERFIKEFRQNPVLAEKAVSLLERLSLYMDVTGYHEVAPKDNYHALDSWSLDRYSPKDLQMVAAWLKGEAELDNVAQKYHNIGFRIVDGGLDIEARDIGDDIELAQFIMTKVSAGFIDKKFIDFPEASKKEALFFEFRDSESAQSSERFTLAKALASRKKLTQRQIDIAHKLQFEIYRPSMNEYMMFGDWDAWNSAPTESIDPAHARANYESNIAMPIWNLEEQAYMQQQGLTKLLDAREAFLEKVYKLILQIEQRPKFDFILKEPNFLYLAKWMGRSTSPDKPNLNKVDSATAKSQFKILEGLVYEMRSYVVEFVHESKLRKMITNSLDRDLARAEIGTDKFVGVRAVTKIPDAATIAVRCETVLF